jgi:hypothetical protein
MGQRTLFVTFEDVILLLIYFRTRMDKIIVRIFIISTYSLLIIMIIYYI